MDYDNWVGRTRTFDRDDPSFWGGFPSIPAFIGRCSPLTKLKMTASSIQRDWYFTSLTPFCSIWRTCMEVTCVYKKGIRVQHKIWRNDCQLLVFFLHQPSGLRMEQSVKSFTFRKEWHVNKFLHFHSFFEGYLKYLSIGK